ncbi:MAG: dCTP deaminase [Candidatus Heimdallarchaeota archaeon]
MVLLSRGALEKAIQEGEIVLDPRPEKLEPASIDLTVGSEAFRSRDDEITYLERGKLLIIPAGDFTLIVTKEYLKLSQSIVGHIGLRSKYTRRGMILMAGPQIDPGFEGNLHIALCNLSPTEVSLSYGDPFCTVEFHRLPEPVKEPYRGEYLGQTSITSDEVRDIRKGRGLALSEAIDLIRRTSENVSKLTESVKKLSDRTDRYMAIFVTTIVALVLGILGKLTGVF